jgi:cation diffusion facilitator CzcD-associated flavoprotein CzcO
MAELTRPFPPGDYPVVVIGSGPGGLQVASSLRALGVEHAIISSDPGPGGMFRRWPFFQRLLSWTKPHAPVPRGTRAYERYDWNSLLTDDPGARAIQAELMDGSSYFPSRPEMQANLEAFVARDASRGGAGGRALHRRDQRWRVPLCGAHRGGRCR